MVYFSLPSSALHLLLNVTAPSSPRCLIIHLPLLSTCHSSPLLLQLNFSLLYLPSSLSPCSSSCHELPCSPRIKSWALGPFSLISSAAWEEALEKWISPLSLSLSAAKAVQGNNSETTSISIKGRRSDRHDPSPLTAVYHVSPPAVFPGGKKKKARWRKRTRLGTRMETEDDLDLVWRNGPSSISLHFPPCPDTMESHRGDVRDTVQCGTALLSRGTELFYPFQPIKTICSMSKLTKMLIYQRENRITTAVSDNRAQLQV